MKSFLLRMCSVLRPYIVDNGFVYNVITDEHNYYSGGRNRKKLIKYIGRSNCIVYRNERSYTFIFLFVFLCLLTDFINFVVLPRFSVPLEIINFFIFLFGFILLIMFLLIIINIFISISDKK